MISQALETQFLETIDRDHKYMLKANIDFLMDQLLARNLTDKTKSKIGHYLMLNDKYSEAKHLLENSKDRISQYYYAVCCYHLKNYNEAEAAFDKITGVMATEPENSDSSNLTSSIYFFRGCIYEEINRLAEALEAFKRCYEIDGCNYEALRRYFELKRKIEFFNTNLKDHYYITPNRFLNSEIEEDNSLQERLEVLSNLRNKTVTSAKKSKPKPKGFNFSNYKEAGNLKERNDSFKLKRDEIKGKKLDMTKRTKVIKKASGDSSKYTSLIKKIPKNDQEITLSSIIATYGYLHSLYYNCAFYECINICKKLPKVMKNSHFVYLYKGFCCLKQSKYKNAVTYFSKAQKLNPISLFGLEYYSTCLWHLNKTKDLVQLSEKLCLEVPKAATTWIVLANSYSALKDHKASITNLKKAINLNSKNSYAYCLLGHEHVFMEDYVNAELSYKKALEFDWTEFHVYWGLGNVYLKTEKFDKALRYFNLAQSLNSDSAVIHTYIGITFMNMKNYENALAVFRTAEAIDPECLMTQYYKSSCLYNVNLHSDALTELEKLKLKLPKESKVFLLLGNIYKKLGNIEMAHKYYTDALVLDPKDPNKKIRTLIDLLNVRESKLPVEFNLQTPKQNK